MRSFKGICPKTNKIETIYCEIINCPTMNEPKKFTIGLMYGCSVDPSSRNLCSDCSIRQVLDQITIQRIEQND